MAWLRRLAWNVCGGPVGLAGMVSHLCELEEPASLQSSSATPAPRGASVQMPGGSGKQHPGFSCKRAAITRSCTDKNCPWLCRHPNPTDFLHLSGPSAIVSGLPTSEGHFLLPHPLCPSDPSHPRNSPLWTEALLTPCPAPTPALHWTQHTRALPIVASTG